MNVSLRAIQFGADLEDADHGQALHARCDTARLLADFRHDQRQLVASVQAEAPRSQLTDDHAELTRLQVLQAALDDMLADDRDLALFGRVDTAHLDRLHRALVRQHAFHFGNRRRRHHRRVAHGRVGHLVPIVQRLHAEDGGMRYQAEDARTHFALEAVHHRQHHDHRQHTQRQADHRGHRDERDEVVAALGSGVARTDEDGQGSEHVRNHPMKTGKRGGTGHPVQSIRSPPGGRRRASIHGPSGAPG